MHIEEPINSVCWNPEEIFHPDFSVKAVCLSLSSGSCVVGGCLVSELKLSGQKGRRD